MHLKFLGVAGLLAHSVVAFGQEQQTIKIEPAPSWVTTSEPRDVPDDIQGAAFVRRQDSIVHLSANGHDLYSSQIIRILQPQALEIGNLAITWNPDAGTARIHKVIIHRNGQQIDVLERSGFEILRREDQLEAAKLDGMLTATLRVPDLRVGDDLEVGFSVPLNDPTLRDASHGLLLMGDTPPPGRYRIELSWDQGQQPLTQISSDFSQLAERAGNRITIQLDDPAPISAPRDAPSRYEWSRFIEFSDFADWPALSRRFHGLFETARKIRDDSPLRDEVAAIKASTTDPAARAKAALELVQKQVRYVYVGLNGGNLTPASADETWERRYGDCKGKTAMLLALLGELEIPAEAVLVNNSVSTDGLDQRLANPELFDHVLVRARIGGKSVWMDGTLPDVIALRADPFLPYDWVLPLTAKGNMIERLPKKPFAIPQEMQLYEIDATSGFDVPARLTRTTISRGLSGLQLHLQLSAVSAAQLESSIKNQLSGNPEWDTVEKVAYRYDKATEAAILTIIGTGPVDWEGDEPSGRYLALPGGGFSPPSRRQRANAAERDIPYFQTSEYSCYVTTVRVPVDTDIDHWAFNTVFDTMLFGRVYYRMMELRKDDRTLRMVRGSRVERPEITAESAERDNQRIANFDNSKAILSYSPGRTAKPWGKLTPVATTTEFDWAGSKPPCLPADILVPGE